VIAFDTNILVYACRADIPFHARARELVESAMRSPAPWAIAWPCVHEFIAIVTNARIFKTPTPPEIAFTQLREFRDHDNLMFLSESDGYLPRLEQIALAAHIRGGAIHDARIAAICLHHGVSELWSADRDFSRFPALQTRNPLL
jgi:toxin-antitoxin system PIN domain toxin